MEHPCDLAQRIGDLLFDDKSSDVTLVVEGERFPAHKAILGTSSEYFRALLLGGMKESVQSEVILKEVPLGGFKLLMSYVYTGQLKLRAIDDGIILEILQLSHLYGFEKLQSILCEHLQGELRLSNVIAIYNTAHLLQLDELQKACHRLIIKDPLAILKTDSFCRLSEGALSSIVSEDTFCAEEIEIFEAVVRWCAENPDVKDMSKVLQAIRLPLIDAKDLTSTVMDSGLIATDVILEAIRIKSCRSSDMKFRASLRPGVNLIGPDSGACELKANQREDLVTPMSYLGYWKKSLPPHPSVIKLNLATGLTIALREAFFINHIAFTLPADYGCSYAVDVSVDLINWVRVIDYLKYQCDSFQTLYFESRAARYIRLQGTRDNNIEISALEISHVSKPFKLSCGFYAPETNVASKALGTWFGIVRKKKGSKGEESYHPTRSETTQDIGDGTIMITFPQPYTVDSMRMLLRSESQAYKYYIETSMDNKNWKRVVDNTTTFCRSWQRMTFEAHPVIWIKIVCTACTVGKHFAFSRFECPAPPEVPASNLNPHAPQSKQFAFPDSECPTSLGIQASNPNPNAGAENNTPATR